MVTSSSLGKLGRMANGMFQIAASIGTASANNDNAVFPAWKYMNPVLFKHPIDQSLSEKDISFQYYEQSFGYSPIPYIRNMSLNGYFQSEKYFSHCSPLIRHSFEPSDILLTNLKLKYSGILDGTTCSIHVRRGDYINPEFTMHDVCNRLYFNRAVTHVINNVQIDTFLVFSDDIEWCRINMDQSFVFISGNSDIEDMFLMSLCTHNIICNSSFSWWGSWLNKNTSKIIVAPDKWFRDEFDMNYADIYTPEMVKISTT